MLTVPHLALADVYQSCETAIEQGDRKRAKADGQIMMNRRPVPYLRMSEIKACLSFGFETEFDFSPELGRIVPSSEAVAAKAAKAKSDAEEAAQKEEIEEAKRLAETRKIKREGAVYARLIKACEEIYSDRPNETITNALCFEVFMARGLPNK
jgi:hypothetical protein